MMIANPIQQSTTMEKIDDLFKRAPIASIMGFITAHRTILDTSSFRQMSNRRGLIIANCKLLVVLLAFVMAIIVAITHNLVD